MTPVNETAAAHAGTVAVSLAGAMQYAAQWLGFDPTPIICAAMGGIFGSTVAPATGPARYFISFTGSSILSGLFGTAIGLRFGFTQIEINSLSAAIAVVFHPLIGAAIVLAPKLVQGIYRKAMDMLGVKESP